MSRLCEITKKRIPHPSNIDGAGPWAAATGNRYYLKRTLKVPEINSKVSLWASEPGMALVKEAGGLAAFLKAKEDNQLSIKLLKIKRKIYGEPKEEKPQEEGEGEAKAEAKTEEKSEEKA